MSTIKLSKEWKPQKVYLNDNKESLNQYLFFTDDKSIPKYESCLVENNLLQQNFLFKTIESQFKDTSNDNKAFAISTSTPSIVLNYSDNDIEWLSVGHIKFKKEQIKKFENVKDFLKKINTINSTNNIIYHYDDLIYMMFFFKFKKNSGKYVISGIGPLFLIYDGQYVLNFPSGLTNTNIEKYKILSYGDGDAYSKFLVVDVTKLTFNNSLQKPEEWKMILINAFNDKSSHKNFKC